MWSVSLSECVQKALCLQDQPSREKRGGRGEEEEQEEDAITQGLSKCGTPIRLQE